MFKDKIETTVTSFKQKVDEKLLAIKDLATIELLMPIPARLRNRLKSIQEMSSAHSIRIGRNWKTQPPTMHISGLTGEKISNDEAVITFNVYAIAETGNNKLTINSAEVKKPNGDIEKREVSAQYNFSHEVKETIRKNKSIKREIMDMIK